MDSSFLDQQQYTQQSISDYQSVWGEGFVSPGGIDKARELIASLGLLPGASLLDVGCGLGGSAFLMAQEFGFQVDAIDLSQNMLAQAQLRCREKGLEGRVSLRFGDCLELDVENQYDAVYSRDAFLHIGQKTRLFEVLHRSLRPGGRLLFTDYCCAEKPWTDAFQEYVANRGYHLHTLDDYLALVRAAGFVEARGDDLTQEFIATLETDLVRISLLENQDALNRAWLAKLERARAGEQRWGLLSARKA
jgi:phosphoethanolamine N-methyltransferase